MSKSMWNEPPQGSQAEAPETLHPYMTEGMTEAIQRRSDAPAEEVSENLTEAQIQALYRQAEDPSPYERLTALRKILRFVPHRALPILEKLSQDAEPTLRHFARTELDRQAKEHVATVEPVHHNRNEQKFQKSLAMCYALYGVAFLLVGLVSLFSIAPNGEYSKKIYLVKFLAGMPFAHLITGLLCGWAAYEVPRNSFEGYVAKWLSVMLILFSTPIGPFVGGWMLFNLTGVGAAVRRRLG